MFWIYRNLWIFRIPQISVIPWSSAIPRNSSIFSKKLNDVFYRIIRIIRILTHFSLQSEGLFNHIDMLFDSLESLGSLTSHQYTLCESKNTLISSIYSLCHRNPLNRLNLLNLLNRSNILDLNNITKLSDEIDWIHRTCWISSISSMFSIKSYEFFYTQKNQFP